jgi:sugar lactone lactonase YvrE
LLESYEGLTAVTDVHVDEAGTLYAVQIADGYGDNGWNPNSGSIITVTADGVTPIAEGLSYPYAMAFAPDGSIAVSVNSSFGPTGSGQVISVGM